MVNWSCFFRAPAVLTQRRSRFASHICRNALEVQLRGMADHGHHQLPVTPSRYQWNKFKDLLHFYAMLGLIPCTAVTLLCNIFVGPAELMEIPPDYEPKHWEYYKHPISRFLARYLYSSPQQEYEKALHYIHEENEKAMLRKLEGNIREKMSERQDYQAYYYRPAIAKYHRISKEAADHLESLRGN